MECASTCTEAGFSVWWGAVITQRVSSMQGASATTIAGIEALRTCKLHSASAAMSVVGFTLRLDGEVSSFTPSVQSQIKSAIAARAGVDPSAVELTISPGSVIVSVRILTPTATAASVQSTMATATSSPSSATLMFTSVTGVSIAVLAVLTPPMIANVAPTPPPLLAVETSGSIGTIIGIIIGVIIALVLALVFMRRRRHLDKKRGNNGGLQVPNGREAQLDEKGAAARKPKAESADEMAAPELKPAAATTAPEAPKLKLAAEEGFELQNTPLQNTPLQNTPLVSSFLGMFSPKPEGVQNV